MKKPLDGFDDWWNNYKHKIPGPKRNSVKHWAKLGWAAHEDHLEQERLQSEEHDKHLLEEYHKAGCPPGWWGEMS